jgi:hypothetical protein
MECDELTVALLVKGVTPNTDELQDAHLHDAGALLAAGPLRDPTGELRGLSLLNAGVDEARRLKEADRALREGVFDLRVMRWQVPAGAMSFAHTFFPRSMADVLGAE